MKFSVLYPLMDLNTLTVDERTRWEALVASVLRQVKEIDLENSTAHLFPRHVCPELANHITTVDPTYGDDLQTYAELADKNLNGARAMVRENQPFLSRFECEPRFKFPSMEAYKEAYTKSLENIIRYQITNWANSARGLIIFKGKRGTNMYMSDYLKKPKLGDERCIVMVDFTNRSVDVYFGGIELDLSHLGKVASL